MADWASNNAMKMKTDMKRRRCLGKHQLSNYGFLPITNYNVHARDTPQPPIPSGNAGMTGPRSRQFLQSSTLMSRRWRGDPGGQAWPQMAAVHRENWEVVGGTTLLRWRAIERTERHEDN